MHISMANGDIKREYESNLLDKETGSLSSDLFKFLVGWEIKRSFRYQDFATLLVLEPDQQPRTPEIFQTLVTLIKKNIRETDLTGRIGNIRLGILLLKSDLDLAYGIASRIMEYISNYMFSNEKNQYVTFSIGGACFPTNSASIERNNLFEEAEVALNVAKKKGNCVYFSGVPVPKTPGGE